MLVNVDEMADGGGGGGGGGGAAGGGKIGPQDVGNSARRVRRGESAKGGGEWPRLW